MRLGMNLTRNIKKLARSPPVSKKRGLANVPPERRREIARLGGKAVGQQGGHRWTSEEARRAGSKGAKSGGSKYAAYNARYYQEHKQEIIRRKAERYQQQKQQ